MGSCCISGEEERVDRELHKQMRRDFEEQKRVMKLLLLGTGESGKSTIFKQMQIIYESGFSAYERQTYRHVTRRNVVEAMQSLLLGARRFNFELDPESQKSADFVLALDPLDQERAFWKDGIVGHIKQLWPSSAPSSQPAAIRQAYANRSHLQLPDSAAYLFDNIDRIGQADYTPTPQDIVRARLRTSGIVQKEFVVEGVRFLFLDVGGQRNERRKWIHCFSDVTAIIFVAAISEYDQVLYEDDKTNRLIESLGVFERVVMHDAFINTPIILFLNKMDLFEEKVPRVPLSDCFPEYEGPQELDPCADYIRMRFVALNTRNDTYTHFTCATDTDNVERVFLDCKHVVLQKNLDKLGLT